MTTKRLRLHDRHAAAGAQFVEVTGWAVPTHYGDPLQEHRAVREAVGISDVSHRGKLRVTGEDRVQWLQSVVSNDVRSLTPGSGLYSSLLTHKGKMLTYFRLYVLPEWVLVEDVGEIGEATFQALRKFLLYGTKAKLENCAETWGLILVSGPRAAELVQRAVDVDVTQLRPPSAAIRETSGHQAVILRLEETGEKDVGLMLPADAMTTVWDRLWEVGQPLGLRPFGTEAREMLRLEAGLPSAGADLTEDIVPPEANLEGKAFSLSKGCYPGQEVVARMDTYGSVRRRLVGLVLEGPTIPSKGAKLYSGEREVGWVSSASHSPAIGKPIAFGFPLRDFTKPGTELDVMIDGQRQKATVHALPFVTPS